jgi:hypothetical protein
LNYIGDNDCQDITGKVYDYVQVDEAGVITTVAACYAKCNGIVDWANVGRGLVFSCALDVCLCYFDDGGLPSNCANKFHQCESSNSGTGAMSAGGSYNGKCFAKA